MVSSAHAEDAMNGVYSAALEVHALFREHNWRYCVIGGLAVIRWGRRRATEDADFSLLTGFGDEMTFLSAISSRISPRYEHEIEFAMGARVYRGVASNGTPIDIALAAFPYEEEVIRRATMHRFRPGCSLMTCGVDDLVVMKAFAGREIDIFDLKFLMGRHWNRLNWDQIGGDLQSLSDWTERYDVVPRFEALKAEVAERRKGR
jgi:hypothetical protein